MCATVCRMPYMQAVAGDIAERHQDYSVQAMTNFVWGATALGFFDEVPSCLRLGCRGALRKHDKPVHLKTQCLGGTANIACQLLAHLAHLSLGANCMSGFSTSRPSGFSGG